MALTWRFLMRIKVGSVKLLFLLIMAIFPLAGCQSPNPTSSPTPAPAASSATSATPAGGDIFTSDSDIPTKVGDGWHQLQKDSGKYYRWSGQQSEIILEPAENTRAKVVIYLNSFNKTRRCDLSMNGKSVASKDITKDKKEVLEFIVDLVKGTNVLKISSPDKSQAPTEIPELSNSDKRSLSFVFWSVAIKKTA
jgi:hypothetical protein